MHSSNQIELARELFGSGLSDYAVARATGIPYTTVHRWRTRGLPARLGNARALCSSCGRACLPLAADQGSAYSYLLGQYLGDGTINAFPRGVFRLTVYGDSRYVMIADEVAHAMRAVLPDNAVSIALKKGGSCAAIGIYSRSIPCLFPQHGRGPKHKRKISLLDWQRVITMRHPEAFIRGLIHSDGARFMNRIRKNGRAYEYARYTFCNTSDDIRALYCEHLDLLGIRWRRMNALNISVARRGAVARLDEFVGPKR